jgi:hypothetical protein
MSIDSYTLTLDSAALEAAVMILWDAKKDTCQIARILCKQEAEIATMLRVGREKRRTNVAPRI